MEYLNETGDFLARIEEKTIATFDSGSVAIKCRFEVFYRWTGSEWESCEPQTCYGSFFIVGKGGHPLEQGIERFAAATGWNGDLDQIADIFWRPKDVRISVKAEEGKNGKTYYKAAWVNAYDTQPTGLQGASAEVVQGLSSRYGSALRAIARKSVSAAPPARQTPPPPENDWGPPQGDDDIPF